MRKLKVQVFVLALCLVAVLAAKHYVGKFVSDSPLGDAPVADSPVTASPAADSVEVKAPTP